MTSHQAEIDLAAEAHAGEKEMAQGRSLEVLANVQPPNNEDGFMAREMQRALEADGEKLRQLTGEDHGPWFDVSGYVAESAASTRTESEARAEKAQAAFLEVATTATLIKLAKSKAHSLEQRDCLSQAAFDELLLAECVWLCDGDELKAKFLASAVLG